jgi:hypothetical protein
MEMFLFGLWLWLLLLLLLRDRTTSITNNNNTRTTSLLMVVTILASFVTPTAAVIAFGCCCCCYCWCYFQTICGIDSSCRFHYSYHSLLLVTFFWLPQKKSLLFWDEFFNCCVVSPLLCFAFCFFWFLLRNTFLQKPQIQISELWNVIIQDLQEML